MMNGGSIEQLQNINWPNLRSIYIYGTLEDIIFNIVLIITLPKKAQIVNKVKNKDL